MDIDERQKLSKFLNNLTFADDIVSPSPSPSHHTSFSPALIAVVCVLAAIFLVVSYYALVARFVDSRRRRSRNRVWDENHRHVVAHDEAAAADMGGGGEEGPIFWPEFGRRGLSKEEIERLPEVEYRGRKSQRSEDLQEESSKMEDEKLGELGIVTDGGERVNQNHKYFYCGSTTTSTDDCAVCLSGFEDGEMVRVLPRCSHGFHFSCIHSWLQSHPNCPLCRTDVLSSSDDDPSSFNSIDIEAAVPDTNHNHNNNNNRSVPPVTAALASSDSYRRRQLHIIDELAQAEEKEDMDDGEALQRLRIRPLSREQKNMRGAGAALLTASRSFHEVVSVKKKMLDLLDEFEASEMNSKLHDDVVEPIRLIREGRRLRSYSTGRHFRFLGHSSHSDTQLAIGADRELDQRRLQQEDSAETAIVDLNDLLAMASSSSNSTSSLADESSSSPKKNLPLASSKKNPLDVLGRSSVLI